MTFEEVLNEAVAMLKRHGRLSYRALTRHFDLDEEYLADLKHELLYTQPLVVEESDRGLAWTGDVSESRPSAQPETNREIRFQTLCLVVSNLLQHERRMTYRSLKYRLGIDDDLLADIREELRLTRLAIDEEDKVLVWTGTVLLGEETRVLPPATTESLKTRETELPHPALSASPLSTAPSESSLNTRDAERRQITVMFCDLVGSTDLSGQLDPEDLREIIRTYQTTAADVIARYDGHIAQYLGDGLLIYFGFPAAHEDDAQRAVHTGLGIIHSMETLNRQLNVKYGVQLSVRIAIHTGPVVVGEMGGGGRHENLALGETPNLAARLEGLAQPNWVVISAVTAQLVERFFLLENCGSHQLKGIVDPVILYRVLRSREMSYEDPEVIGAGGFEVLVGRDEEIGLLLRRWEQSKEGVGQVVLVSGEAGIGKSSLVTGLRNQVRGEGRPRIAFQCSPYHTNNAYYPIVDYVQYVINWHPDDDVETKVDKLEQAIHRSRLNPEEAVPSLAGLLSLPLPEARYAPLTLPPQQQRQQAQDTLVAWLLEEAERQPVLTVWEDLHWADPSTLDVLKLFIDQAPTAAMLHVLTFRPEFEPPWPSRSHLTPLPLNRLERPQVEALVMRLTSGKSLPAEVMQHIVAKTDGVPLYIEELTKMLLTSKFLREETEQYVLTGPLLTVAIPDTLQDSLMARLDQLPRGKEVVQLGSVIGREFTYDLLQAISSQDDQTLQVGLAQLVEAELLYQRGRPPRATYKFKHALIQDAAYNSLLRSQRQPVHQKIAETLEDRLPETIETQPELLAYHYTAARLPIPAVTYWKRAGQRSRQRSANAEAISYLSKGLELLQTLPAHPDRAKLELDLQLTLGIALNFTTQSAAEVGEAFSRAVELSREVGDIAQLIRALHGLRSYYSGRAQHRKAQEVGLQMHALGDQVEDPALLIRVNQYASEFYLGNFSTARERLEQAIAIYHRWEHSSHNWYGKTHAGVSAFAWYAWILWYLGYPDQAREKAYEALSLAQDLSDPNSLITALNYVTRVLQYCGDTENLAEQAELLESLSVKHGVPIRQATGTFMRGCACLELGEIDEAMALMNEGFAGWSVGAVGNQTYFLARLAEGYCQAKQPEDGLCMIEKALTLVTEGEERFCEAELYQLQGDLLLQQSMDHATQAEDSFRQAITIAGTQQTKSLELRATMSLARLWKQQGQPHDARALLMPIYDWFTEGYDTADLQAAQALYDALA